MRRILAAAILLTSLSGCAMLDGFTDDPDCVCEYRRESTANDGNRGLGERGASAP